MLKWLQKIIHISVSIIVIFGCENSTEDNPVNSFVNEPASPDAPEIYYDLITGYFYSWGTGLDNAHFNYYMDPGAEEWLPTGKRNISNAGWWKSYNGLYAGGVPGGVVVNGVYRQAYSCELAIGIMSFTGSGLNTNWTDLGEPVVTAAPDPPGFGSIVDVSLMMDFDNRLWLVHGSGSIYIVELDPNTLKLKHEPNNTFFDVDDRWTFIADGGRSREEPTIEGAFIFPHKFKGINYYYLFVTWGKNDPNIWNSYEIRMGRATSPTGPYFDRTGIRMDLEHGPGSGGTLLLDDKGKIIEDSRYQIPGHPGVCEFPVKEDGTRFVFSFHFHPEGGSEELLAAKQMYFDTDGWPFVTKADFDPTEAVTEGK